MLSMLYVRLTIKVKVGIPGSVKVGWYPHKITGSSHLKDNITTLNLYFDTIIIKAGKLVGSCKLLTRIR